jgi:hypothetical protein
MTDSDPVYVFLRDLVVGELRRYDRADPATSVGRFDRDIATDLLSALQRVVDLSEYDPVMMWRDAEAQL